MSINISRRHCCRLCDATEFYLALSLSPTPLADAYVSREHLHESQPLYPLDLYLCRACGHVQLLDIVQPEVVYIDYIYETTSSLGLVEHFSRYASEVLEGLHAPEGSLVVDIGSNDGSLLRAFKRHGMRVLGVDPAKEIARKATDSGIETLPEFFSPKLVGQIKSLRGRASLVTCNNLFANVDDVATLTDGVRELLSADGLFVFESFYLVDYVNNMVFDFAYHEHLSYHSVKPLRQFLSRQGMELIDAIRIPTKGGSLRYIAQIAGGLRRISQRVEDLIALEELFGMARLGTFESFADRIHAAKAKLLEFLRPLKAQGKTIAGYGASATTTTLLYHFGLTGLLDFIADDYPAKQNLYCPGCHIPVLPSTALYERKPDYVIVLAWRYVAPIVEKHSAYLEKGGHFVTPLPTFEVI